MNKQQRSRNMNWKTRALTLNEGERRIIRCQAEVLTGRDKGVVSASEGTMLGIGTAPGNQLILTDASVSRHHCVIEAKQAGFLLRDLDSTNGTSLGGHHILSAYIENGAILNIGESAVRFTIGSEELSPILYTKHQFGDVLGCSVVMRSLFTLMQKMAGASATVLMTGETGTGKGAFASALHSQSNRSEHAFVVVDCGAIPDNLIESELFGHEKGAFTGAVEQRIGAFELANNGTIFLDEIGELGIEMQPKLLRVLENRQFRRVGGSKTISTDIRIIAATNRDLRQEINRGSFREDLFYRLNVMNMEVPALRERQDDIPMLIESFYRHFTKDQTAKAPASLIQKLMRRNFPGNVRELKSAVERFVVLGDLGHTLDNTTQARQVSDLDFTIPYREAKEHALNEWACRYLPELVDRYDGNLSRAARAVLMDRNHLRKMLKALKNE